MTQIRRGRRRPGLASEQQSPLPADRETPASCTPISSPAAPAAPPPAERSRAGAPSPRRAPEASDALCPVTPWPC